MIIKKREKEEKMKERERRRNEKLVEESEGKFPPLLIKSSKGE